MDARTIVLRAICQAKTTMRDEEFSAACQFLNEQEQNESCRYFLFNNHIYYPSGGAFDYVGSFPTLEDAKEEYEYSVNPDMEDNWAHIVRSDNFDVVSRAEFDHDKELFWYDVEEDDDEI
ncbi:hypothetical protein KAR91_30335 [Candidatus Pacearchaeota archaeon]|nr:hypothetical protein [Candidatus Pacearchaeota archaeon]